MTDFETRIRAELREVADRIEPERSLAELRARIERRRPRARRWRRALARITAGQAGRIERRAES